MARRAAVTFEGLNLAKTISVLAQKYTLFNVQRKGRLCVITVNSADVSKVVAFLKERCYNVSNIQKVGWDFVFSFTKKHFLLPIFCILAFATLFVFSNICLKVSVSGDFSREEVLSALDECGVGVGDSLFGFSADAAENGVAAKLDAMYAVITRKGSALYVNVVKRKTIDAPIDMHTRRDLVATASGRVLSLLCEQGEASVAVGDCVKKGDTLILGKRTFADGTCEDVYALGKVVLELCAEGFAEYTGTITETVETGNTFCADGVVLFGKTYVKQPPFENYRIETTETRLAPLNVVVKRLTYRETHSVTVAATLEECLDFLKSLALERAIAAADFEVVGVSYRVTAEGVFAEAYGEAVIS